MARFAVTLALALAAGCGGDGEDGGGLLGIPRAPSYPAEPCPGAVSLQDEAGDAPVDLQQFELSATADGVCVRWTMAEPPLPGTIFTFNARGPWVPGPGGRGSESHGYGFDLVFGPDGPRATFGLDRIGSHEPRVLEVRAGQSGRTVSAFVARSELDRPPSNVPDRPPFPYRAFFFGARVSGAAEGSEIDFLPATPSEEPAYLDGQLCPAPCQNEALGNGPLIG